MFQPKQWKGRKLRVWILIVCGLAFSLFGYDCALYGGIASGPPFVEYFHHPSPGLTGQVAALFDIGNLVGALCTPFIAERIGHRKSILIGSAICVIGAIIQTTPGSIGGLIAGRMIGGFGNGINTSVFLTLGTSFSQTSLQWRLPSIFQVVYLLPVFILLPLLPESPRWLASKDRMGEAATVLARLTGQEDISSPEVRQQLEDIQTVVALEKAGEATPISDLWTAPGRHMYRLIIGCGAQYMGQIGGCNVFAYYIVIIFEQLGFSSTPARVLAACTGVPWLLSNLFSQFAVERFGRRPLFFSGSIGQGLCFLIAGIVLAIGGNPSEGTAKWSGYIVVVLVYLYLMIFALAWQSLQYLYPAEILSFKYRNKFYPVANAVNWTINYVVVVSTPPGLANIGWKFYMVFFCFNFVNFWLVFLFYPETAHKSLEEIDLLFLSAKSATSRLFPGLASGKKGAFTVDDIDRVGFEAEMKQHRTKDQATIHVEES
ncbi:hypothetical protein CLAIMM_14917 isoform 1 [Cladophialophora immunda]|nr:hypothetical protein CLAIMM_14917 isoform 1 [Cladophialophora immunda]